MDMLEDIWPILVGNPPHLILYCTQHSWVMELWTTSLILEWNQVLGPAFHLMLENR